MPVNPRDINGKTPLFLASSAGATEVVAILMEKGGDVTIKDIEGNSVLHAANGFTATTEALLKVRKVFCLFWIFCFCMGAVWKCGRDVETWRQGDPFRRGIIINELPSL